MSDQDNFQEHELLRQVAMGDEIAFRQLFTLYHHQLGAYIYRITESTEVAEEIVQDVFLKIWMSREALQVVKNFRAYLFVTSKNHALNVLRKIIRERNRQSNWDEDTINAIPLADNDDLTSQYYGLLDKAIDCLPPQQQKVYLLSRHEHLKYIEIAERLNLSRETVKKYLQIAVSSITNYIQTNDDIMVLITVVLYNKKIIPNTPFLYSLCVF